MQEYSTTARVVQESHRSEQSAQSAPIRAGAPNVYVPEEVPPPPSQLGVLHPSLLLPHLCLLFLRSCTTLP